MTESQTPREFALDLALRGKSAWRIRRELEKHGWEKEVDALQMERIMMEAGMAHHFAPRIGVAWPRVLGALAFILGILFKLVLHRFFSGEHTWQRFWEAMTTSAPTTGWAMYKWSPERYCVAAMILGIILLIKPHWSRKEVP